MKSRGKKKKKIYGEQFKSKTKFYNHLMDV